MEASPRLLVVDDDREIRTLLADYLDANGFRTEAAADGAGMWAAIERAPFDLIILDLTLPGTDGLTLCRTLRARSTVPVIMLTARGASLDRILGLEMGADDYLPKPFEPRELLARIRSVLRRTQAGTSSAPRATARKMRFGDWTLDVVARHLVDASGTVVALSGAEFRLISVFVDNPNAVLTRDQILDLTHQREADAFDRSVDSQVSRLRQKLRDDADGRRLIKTVRNEGYVLAASVSVES